MSAYNFQKRFVDPIKAKTKRSTIRKRRKNGYLPKPGEKISLYTGMRTSNCKLIRRVTVFKVTPITINTVGGQVDSVILDGKRLGFAELIHLYSADGFRDVHEFAEFFNSMYGDSVQAYLIEW